MPSLLIVKLGAAGDVVRTTTILHLFKKWDVDWLVADENQELVPRSRVRTIITDIEQIPAGTFYNRVINLEDDIDVTRKVISRVQTKYVFGSVIDSQGQISYTQDSSRWFDMSLISRFGLEKANQLKLANRLSYQEIIFSSLGYKFSGEKYILPSSLPATNLKGDIAVAPSAGNRWPTKNWFYFDKLIDLLSKDFVVNILPHRTTISEHISDISNHQLIICNDSLPMHLALGLGIPVISFFTCTSPWEIYDYGLLTKLVSPKLQEYFYKRDYFQAAAKSISIKAAYDATLKALALSGAQQASGI
jgi:heptosyltransferase-2